MLIPNLDFSTSERKKFRDAFEYPFKERFMKIDNVEVCYIDEGKGLPILMVHGLGGNLLHFKMNINHFKDRYRIIAIDLPGCGKSDKPELFDTVPFFVNLLRIFLKRLKVSELLYIGNSMGGHIGCMFAAKFKKLTKGLILVDSAGLYELNLLEDLFISTIFKEELLASTPSFIMETSLKHNFYNAPEEAKDILLAQKVMASSLDYDNFCHALDQCAQSMRDNSVDYLLDEIKCPTLIIWGKNDRLLNYKLAQGFKDGIANTEMKIYESCGHIAMAEKFNEFNADVEKFIAKHKITKSSGLKKFFSKLKK